MREILSTRKATGYDGMQLAPSLTRIFNTSIEQKTWLADWKRGEWVPVYTL